MLSMADGTQQGFFDAHWCGQVVPADSFYGLLAEHGHRIVSDRDFAACYAEGRGRPSIPPSHLAKILLLAYREGASDRQAMERVRYDLRWKVALGLALDHPGYHPTSLVKFRARLLLHGMERLALERRRRLRPVLLARCLPGRPGPTQDQSRAARGSSAGRDRRHRRPGPSRTPPPCPASDRAAALAPGPSLPGPPEPLLRAGQGAAAGRLERRPGEPQPDRDDPPGPGQLIAAATPAEPESAIAK